jgi:hypothetical protein
VRRFGIVAAVVATLIALACVAPGKDVVAQPVVEVDVVVQLTTANPDAPVGVAFGRHAAIYLLERNDPNFTAWLAVLQQSLRQGTRVRFSYDVEGPRLTLVEPAQ